MVAVSLQVRPAVFADQRQIANLMYFESRVHRHLDWRAPLDWLGFPYYWVLESDDRIQAALACPQDPPGIGWVRLFACAASLSGLDAWSPLWETARAEIRSSGGAQVAVIAQHHWFQDILIASHFELHQNIVLLEWNQPTFTPRPIPPGVHIRSLLKEDLPSVTEVDNAAFAPLWCNSFDSLEKALSQAIHATVAETDEGIVGYQISTANPLGAHLARLAVRPEAQERGIGAALVSDLIVQMEARRKPHLTVNTQSDNSASLSLYKNLGFALTGEQYPVFLYPA